MAVHVRARGSITPLIFVMLFLARAPLRGAGEPAAWRSWGTADGFAESFTGGIALGPDGRVWIKHGRVGSLSVLDGFTTLQVPAPPTLGTTLRVYGADSLSGKDDTGRYFEYRRQNWVAHDVFADNVANLGNGRILLVRADRLAQYDTGTRAEQVIRRAAETHLGKFLDVSLARRSGTLWILGQNGAALLKLAPTRWKEYEFTGLGLQNARAPFEDDDGVLFAVATETRTRKNVLACFDGKRWDVAYRGKSQLARGWPGATGTLWLQDTDGLHRLAGGRLTSVDRDGVLSGTIRSVMREPGGAFWVGTNQGTARHADPVWRTPQAVVDLRSGIEAARESPAGTVWFASARGLLRLRGEAWTEFPFPPQWSNTEVSELLSGPEGTMLLGSMTPAILLAFDERRNSYRQISPPQGHSLQYVLARDAGSVWVCTKIKSTGQFTLQIYDRAGYREFLRLEPEWQLGVIRAIL